MRSNIRSFFLGMLITTGLLAAASFASVKEFKESFLGIPTDETDVKCVKINPSVMRCRDKHATCYVYWENSISCVSRSFEPDTD